MAAIVLARGAIGRGAIASRSKNSALLAASMAGCCGAGGFGHVQDSVQPYRIRKRSIVGADKPHKQIDTLLGSEQLVTFDQEAARLLAAAGEPVILL